MKELKLEDMTCPLQAALSKIGGRYKIDIIFYLFARTMRFNELSKAIPMATPKMLIQQLKALEADGIISRKVYAQVPPRTEYSLTEFGESLAPAVLELYKWGEKIFIVNGKQDFCPSEEVARVMKLASETQN